MSQRHIPDDMGDNTVRRFCFSEKIKKQVFDAADIKLHILKHALCLFTGATPPLST